MNRPFCGIIVVVSRLRAGEIGMSHEDENPGTAEKFRSRPSSRESGVRWDDRRRRPGERRTRIERRGSDERRTRPDRRLGPEDRRQKDEPFPSPDRRVIPLRRSGERRQVEDRRLEERRKTPDRRQNGEDPDTPDPEEPPRRPKV
jgi:hypothetical protein